MVKILKIIGRIIGIPLEWLMIFLIIFLFAIRTSSFQTFLAHKLTAYLSEELKAKVAVGKVDIVFFDRVYLDKIIILDLKKDTLLALNSAEVNIDNFDLFGKKIIIKDLKLVNGLVNVTKSAQDGKYNFQFLVDYFESDEPKTPSDPFDFKIQKIWVANLNVHYHDLNVKRTPNTFNSSHLDLTKLNFVLDGIKVKDDDLYMAISDFSVSESCGLNLKSFNAKLAVKEKSVNLSNVQILLNDSKLNASTIGINWKNDKDFEEFSDKVIWDIKLNSSTVMLGDIVYFVPEMSGMKDKITLEAHASNTLSHLFLKDLKLRYADNTFIHADLELPNFNDVSAYDFREIVHSATLDSRELNKFALPRPYGNLNLGKELSELGIVRLNNLDVKSNRGVLTIGSTIINTSIGNAAILQPIRLVNGETFEIIPTNKNISSISLQQFDLGKMLAITEIGTIDGEIGFATLALNDNGLKSLGINANFKELEVLDYSLKNMMVTSANLYPDSFEGDLKILDPNLDLEYAGKINFGKNPFLDLALKLNIANLSRLNLGIEQPKNLKGDFVVKFSGSDITNLAGSLSCRNVIVEDESRQFEIPSADIVIVRSPSFDELTIKSSILDLELKGKIDPNTVVNHFVFELAKSFPSMGMNIKKLKGNVSNDFTYTIKSNDLNPLLTSFIPELTISNGFKMNGRFDSNNQIFEMHASTDEVIYNDMSFKDIEITQSMSPSGIEANYSLSTFKLQDSLSFNDINLTVMGTKGYLNSCLVYDPGSTNNSVLEWNTTIANDNSLVFDLMPSFFSINDIRWEIKDSSSIKMISNAFYFENFLIERGRQNIKISGVLSKNDSEKLTINLNEIDLKEFSELLKLDIDISGEFTGHGDISNPYSNIIYSGNANISNLFIMKNEIGNISLQTSYDDVNKIIELKKAELLFRNVKTVNLSGAYFLKRERDKLKMDLNFLNTDLSILNGFTDPNVILGIKGKLLGNLQVKGSIDAPELSGELDLVDAGAKVELLGVRYTLNGKINVEKNLFNFKDLPVKDEDGNMAMLIGNVYHTNFDKWAYDFHINFQSLGPIPQAKFNLTGFESKRFLVLNTKYKEGESYYGKAYCKGYATIKGNGGKMDVDVLLETKSGSQLNFPMYGVSEIEEEDDLIHFVEKSIQDVKPIKYKSNYTGLTLNMKFKLTPEAKLKIIFNEQLGDEISAVGAGDIALKLDAFNNLNLEGTYSINKGSQYNFAMGPLKQPFEIQPGSTITWTGNIYDANIDIITAFTIKKVSILDLSPELVDKTLLNQDVVCRLKLNETLDAPKINFEILAPNASESGKSMLSRVNAEIDELNRQFFSLLLVKKFQPLKGAVSASGAAAFDLVESQINGLLGQLSKDYKVNVDLGQSNALASVQKNFLNDRLLVTGSFGVENNTTGGNKSSGFIGDVSLEYLVNPKGTLRVNVFNKSNTNTVDENSGPFTQGAGLSYHEEFNTINDFELAQSVFDIFRPKDKKYFKSRRKKKQTRLPPLVINDGSSPVIKTDE